MNRILFYGVALLVLVCSSCGSKISLVATSVPEEGSSQFVQITNQDDHVCGPRGTSKQLRYSNTPMDLSNIITLALSPTEDQVAFLSKRSDKINIFIKSILGHSVSQQRTFRTNINSFAYSPDGKMLCFSEISGEKSNLFTTDAKQGTICQQLTEGFNPVFSEDMHMIFFERSEAAGTKLVTNGGCGGGANTITIYQGMLWSYNRSNSQLSTYVKGGNPCIIPGESSSLYCIRNSDSGSEIWKINYTQGKEEIIYTASDKKIVTPQLSPNGKWLTFVMTSRVNKRQNADIYVIKVDGSQLTQLTYHQADDFCPVWSGDGKYIYMISSRGNDNENYNVWKMSFPLQ